MQKELDALQGSEYRRVAARIRALAEEPRGASGEKLYDDVYRVRIGDWRIIYLVDDANRRIDVGAIRRRSERTYKGLAELFA